MASTDSTPSAVGAATATAPVTLSGKKENIPITPKLAELNESREELLNRIQNLKHDLRSWRSKLDTQVNVYRDELLELKKSLNVEVDQLRSEFQELRTTLQQQQEDVTASLKNLGDVPVGNKESDAAKIEVKDEKDLDLPKEENKKDVKG